jgi:hypothetical protein
VMVAARRPGEGAEAGEHGPSPAGASVVIDALSSP